MLPDKADIIIIGSGAMGLSTAYNLALHGCSNIVVLEGDSFPGGHSTGRCAGGFRHQFSTEINIMLSKMSFRLLQDFKDQMLCNTKVDNCGYMFVLTENDDIDGFKNAVLLQRKLGVDTKWLEPEEIRKRIPMVNLKDVVASTYNELDGLIDVGNIINLYINAINRMGVKLFVDTQVLDIEISKGRISHVVTSKGNIKTSVVVNAAGPWSMEIGKMVQVDLPVKPVRQQLFVTSELNWITKDFPVVIFPYEGIGFHKEGKCLLSGLNKDGTDKLSMNPSVDTDWELYHCEKLIERIPDTEDSQVISSWAGFYDMTPDLHPIIGRIPGIEGFYCITGFSGHGFMHSPACGLLLSEEILYGKAKSLDISSLYVNRFNHSEKKSAEFFRI